MRAQDAPNAVGDALVDIGGRRLHVSCVGAGSPTVIEVGVAATSGQVLLTPTAVKEDFVPG